MILCTLAICSSSFSFLLHLEISAQTKLMTWNYLFIIFITRNDTKYRYYRPILFSRNIKSHIINTKPNFELFDEDCKYVANSNPHINILL